MTGNARILFLLKTCLWLLFFGNEMLYAQPSGNDWFLNKILNDDSGLPQNSVNDIYYDAATNFLWISTNGGIARYDGMETRVFSPRNLPGLSTGRIGNFMPTLNHDVLGTDRNGQFFKILETEPKIIQETTSSEYANYFKVILNLKDAADFITLNKLFEQEVQNEIAQNYSPPDSSFWFTTAYLNDSVLAVQTDISLIVFNRGHIVCNFSLPSDYSFKRTMVLGKDMIYALDNNMRNFYCLNWQKNSLTKLKLSNDLLSKSSGKIIYDKWRNLPLLLFGNFLYELTFKNDSVNTKLIATLPTLPTGNIQNIIISPDASRIFIGTATNGLYIYKKKLFYTYFSNDAKITNNLYACAAINNGRAISQALTDIDLNTGNIKQIQPGNNAGPIAFAIDSSKNIWYYKEAKLICRTSSKFKLIKEYPLTISDLKGDPVLYLSTNKTLWISTLSYLGYVKDGDIRTVFLTRRSDINIKFITEDPTGRLWGIYQSGIAIADTVSGEWSVIKNVNIKGIRFISIDNAEHCWITTYGFGCYMYDIRQHRLYSLPVDGNEFLLYSHSIIDDQKGNFIVPTNKGLFVFDKIYLLQQAYNPSGLLLYRYFDARDGLLANEFNGGATLAYTRLNNGDLLIPSLQGLVRMFTYNLPTFNPASIYFDKITSKYRTFNPDSGQLKLNTNERTLLFTMSAGAWNNSPSGGVIAFRQDDDIAWTYIKDGHRQIQLNELDGGNHQLYVRFYYGATPSQFTERSIDFVVKKKLIEEVWFRVTIIVLLIACIYIFFKLYTFKIKADREKLQKLVEQRTTELKHNNELLEETMLDLNVAVQELQNKNQFNAQLIALISHDLLTPLQYMAKVSRHSQDNAGNIEKKDLQETLSYLNITTRQLLQLGQSLMEWIKLQEGQFKLLEKNINIYELAVEMAELHQFLFESKNNHLAIEISKEMACRFDPIVLKVIIHNLLQNANKFTEDGLITIAASITNGTLAITVSDTGIGMSEELVKRINEEQDLEPGTGTQQEKGQGFGYRLMRELIYNVKGVLKISSTPGKGVIVNVFIPLKEKY